MPVIVNVSEFTGLPGPLMLVSGGRSARPNVSNFLAALVLSAVPLVATARARTCSSRLPEMVSGSDQVRFGPVPASRVALNVLSVVLPHVVRLSAR